MTELINFTEGNATTMDHAQVKTSETITSKPERKRRAGIFPTVAALTGIGIAALTGCSPDAGATPEPTSTSAEASPSATPDTNENINSIENTNQTVEHDPIVTPENEQEVIESLQIDSSLSPEEKADQVMDVISRWYMAGATPEAVQMEYENTINGDELQGEAFAASIAQQNQNAFATALYGEDWENTTVANVVYSMTESNAANIDRYLSTFGSDEHPNTNSKNKEAYTESYSENIQLTEWADANEQSHPSLWPLVERAQKTFESDDVLIMNITANRSNNAENNMFGENATYAEANGQLLYTHVVLTPENGHDVIRYLQTDTHDFGNSVSYEASQR